MCIKPLRRSTQLFCNLATVMCVATLVVRADEFHGLNAGAPVWNGSVVLTPQMAQEFAATGTRAIRVNFRLDSGATSWNANQLTMYDQVISNATNAGLQVLGLFSNETVAGGQAAWNDDPDNDGLNSYVSQYASTAQLLVSRYGGTVHNWEVWNEPNAWSNPNYASDPQNAGGTYILPRVYAQLLTETYRALDSASLIGPQGAQLTSGGLLAHDIGGSFSTAMDYMQQVYNQNSVWNAMQADFGRRYPWDDLGYHVYISQGSLLQTSQLANYMNAVRTTEASNNDSANIAITEFGWQTVGTNTQQLQRDNMATAYDYFESKNYVSGTYWYQWTDDVTGAWGIVDGANQPKLSYTEFAARNASSVAPIHATTQHAVNDVGLSYAYSNSDILQGLIPTVLPGDLGWHSANPASTDPNDPNGLPAFTDGIGDLGSGATGLLNDYPAAGEPAKPIDYDLGEAHDINEIRIFTGNNGNDGRIFSTTAIWTSTNGNQYTLLGYFQSDSSGTQNNSSTPGGPDGATLVRVFRDNASPLAEDVTHLRFYFYAVSDVNGLLRDPFDGVNTFTGVDDGLTAAYVSPLVREIDVFGMLSAMLPGDFNSDGIVDAADYVVWRKTDGSQAGYDRWRANFGASIGSDTARTTATSVPEPGAWLLLIMAMPIAFALRTARAARCEQSIDKRRGNETRRSPPFAAIYSCRA